MKCKSCATQLAKGALFCHKCGTKVEKGCPSCGKELIEGAAFCAFCGTSVAGRSEVIEVNKFEEPVFFQANEREDLSDELEGYFGNNKSYYIGNSSRDFNRMCYPYMLG